MNDYEFLASQMTEETLLCQIAEEAAELAHAALKLRRVLVQDSPTAVNRHDAVMNLLEEMADVQLSGDVWKESRFKGHSADACSLVDDFVDAKRERWMRRLKER